MVSVPDCKPVGGGPHQLVLENAKSSEEVDGVEQDAVCVACDGSGFHSDLHLWNAHLLAGEEKRARRYPYG